MENEPVRERRLQRSSPFHSGRIEASRRHAQPRSPFPGYDLRAHDVLVGYAGTGRPV